MRELVGGKEKASGLDGVSEEFLKPGKEDTVVNGQITKESVY